MPLDEKLEKSLLLTSTKAALDAGRAVLEVYGRDFSVEEKSDGSPLTEADCRSHNIIRSALAATSLPLLSEEGADQPYEERKDRACFWMVDPLDGTKEFIKKNGEFTVNIALIEDNRPILGVVYAPVLNQLFVAGPNTGALFADREQIEASGEADIAGLLQSARPVVAPASRKDSGKVTVAGSRSHGSEQMEVFLTALKAGFAEVSFISAGSSLKFLMVADGRADVYPRFGPTMEWDTAAGQAVAERAGCVVQKIDASGPLAYNKEDLHNPGFVVIGPDLRHAVVSLLEQMQ